MRVAIPALLLTIAATALAAPPVVDGHLKIDQLGYRPTDVKVAVLSDPVTGYNAPDPYSPAATLEVRRWLDDSVAFSGPSAPWRGGAVHAQSGDRVWWFDFSGLTEIGAFYVWDPVARFGSHRFEIADGVYQAVLAQATRTFFYQRCGADKAAAHAGPAWADGRCHVGAQQDTDCRAVLTPTPATSRDLSGGWHDAGDYNKYVNFADGPVHDLLAGYQASPAAWGDDYDLPESGNCVADLLDELRIELDWFGRMQLVDGSILHKVSVTDFSASSPPSADPAPRRYAPATASATVSACGAFAHAAIVFRSLGDPVLDLYAAALESQALAAWNWLEINPGVIPSNYDNAGFQNATAEDSDYEQMANRVCAATYLYALTSDPTYRAWVDARYRDVHLVQWGFAYPFEPEYQDCLLYYAATSGATPAVASEIEAAYRSSMRGADNLGHWLAADDAYRAHLDDGNYTWGSNRTKALQGLMFLAMTRYGLDPPNDANYRAAAGGYLHYLHGVNPLGLVYLTNLGGYGAETSVQEMYHGWFADGTAWDNATTSLFGPAPGFVPGGPNPSFAPDPSYTGPPLEPPQRQPIQKSYRDWNTSWPQNSWEVTENSITYQAAYIRLLGQMVPDAAAGALPSSPGNSLSAARRGVDVELSWTAATGADRYEVLRCDATGAACVPTAHATEPALSHVDIVGAGVDYWYQLAATNGCGSVP